MQAQVTLTPAESKKLIAQATLAIPKVQNALKNGLLVMHPSSSTLFIYEMLFGKLPEGLWICGCITNEGLSASRESKEMTRDMKEGTHDPRKSFRHSFFIDCGKLQPLTPIGEILDKMGEGDVYIKGANAVDVHGNTAVLFGEPHGGGGIVGAVQTAQKANGFTILMLAGLEKLIPGFITDACRAADRKAGLVMGMPCGLYPVKGEKIDEVDAIRILCGATAHPIGAGGLNGAEGSIVLAIDGDDDTVLKAFKLVEGVKGARLPEIEL